MAVQGVAGQWEASLAVNGQDVAIAPGIVSEITVRSGIHRNLPTYCVKTLDRAAEILLKSGLADGATIDIELGDGSGSGNYSGVFRAVGNPKGQFIPKGLSLESSGVLDHVPWMRKVADKHFKGTSSQMLGMLAGQVGLKLDADPTNDLMTWLPNRQPLASYARLVEDHGYAGSSSCMIMCVNEDSTLRYKDIQKIIGSSPSAKFSNGGSAVGAIPTVAIELSDKSGIYNNSAAYGSTTLGETQEGLFKLFSKVTASQMGQRLSFSSALSSAIGDIGGRIMHFPIMSGNAHEKYHEARHQNMRIKSTYGFDVNITVPQRTGVNNLDLVSLLVLNPMDGTPMNVITGNYMVTNKVMTVNLEQKHQRYFEKLTLTSQSI